MATKTAVRHTPDATDRALLNELQKGLVISPAPYAEVAERVGIGEDDALARIRVLKDARIVRQISPIFDTRTLGYTSSLVAARYPEDRLFEGAAVVSGHPGVSHNYRRTHAFNLWFTVAIAPGARLGLEETIDVLARESGAESMRLLPTLRLYKINVQLDMTDGNARDAREEKAPAPKPDDTPPPPDEADRELIRVLQRDLPVETRPIAALAAGSGRSEDDLLEALADFERRGYMRRFAAVLNHRKAGFGANGMAVWRAPEDRLEELGPRMSAFKAVSHCYRRPTYPDWPYNVFTMVHARSKEACEETIAAIAEETGLTGPEDRAVLYSTYEFKKVRLAYFTPEYAAWEDLALAGEELPRWTKP
jgi:DNA-binding Lrp family transcriptional regulator